MISLPLLASPPQDRAGGKLAGDLVLLVMEQLRSILVLHLKVLPRPKIVFFLD